MFLKQSSVFSFGEIKGYFLFQSEHVVLIYSLNVSLVRSWWESAHIQFNLWAVYYDMFLYDGTWCDLRRILPKSDFQMFPDLLKKTTQKLIWRHTMTWHLCPVFWRRRNHFVELSVCSNFNVSSIVLRRFKPLWTLFYRKTAMCSTSHFYVFFPNPFFLLPTLS